MAARKQGGAGEAQELRLWIHHGTSGLPHLPTTSDQVEYGGLTWKVTDIDPTYRSNALIASKLVATASVMAKKFRGPEIVREIDEALDKGLSAVSGQYAKQVIGSVSS